jgi:hypothetical protein
MTSVPRTIAAPLVLVALSAVWAVGAEAQVATGNPHGALPDDLTCTSCHSTEAWSPLRRDLEFDHRTDTDFALDGRHEAVTCASCHEGLIFEGVAPARNDDCASCHLDVHLGTPTRPCVSCHTTESFRELPPGVVHPADFPLEGAHLQVSCESCHSDDLGGAFSPPDRDCLSCHLGDYMSVPLVDHQALGFSTNCTECHSTLDFRDVAFDHFTYSGGFELRGQHRGVECTSCHSGGGGTVPGAPAGPDDCVACHLPDYQDEHGGSGYPTDCLACHNESTWDGAVFDHLLVSGFELVSVHSSLDCVYCHVGSTSQTIFAPSGPQDCYACHQDDYEREHAGTGFSTDCTACHQPDTWAGAVFEHPFPITSGAHVGRDCSECHEVPGDYVEFTCTSACHHTRSRTDPQHTEVVDYLYDSRSCLSCHADGRS